MSKSYYDSYESKDSCRRKSHKHHQNDDEQGLLAEFDVDQSPSVPVPTTGVFNMASAIAEVDVKVDDYDDRVSLLATVEWSPTDLPLGVTLAALITAITGAAAGIVIPLTIPATFRIWRRSSSGTTLISQKTDESGISGIAILTGGLVTLLFENVTTTIHAVDTDPSKGENEYFLTIDLGTFAPGTTIPGVAPTLLGTITLTPQNVVSYTFSAAEIEDNQNHKKYKDDKY
ncbi:hypothetical protein [Heyndrickxia acidiproducens]|uniref:hypothetical protein n=1 Tax=Heyndrickxia acidiproducens TaxID=1121084 RepID=UPI000380DD99|nr:hypothetical protein [Heyndrickxia acidiproducens]